MKRTAVFILVMLLLSLVSFSDDDTEKIEKLGRECQAGKAKACSRLIKISISRENEDLRLAALEQLGDMRISNSGDQAILAKIAVSDKNKFVRAEAVKRLLDQNLIAEIARRDSDNWVKDAAVDVLSNESLLIEIAWLETGGYTSARAVRKISDQAALAEIGKEAKDWVVREAAAEVIQDEIVLGEIATADKSEYVRLRAVLNSRLAHQGVLNSIANNDSDLDVRQAAALKTLVSQEELLRLCDIQAHNRLDALKQLDNQKALAIIADHDSDRDVNEAAVERLSDQRHLAELAQRGRFTYVRCSAIAKLKDQALLNTVAKTDKDAYMRSCAIAHLSDAATLGQIARSDRENFYFANKRLRELNAGIELETLMNDVGLNESNRLEVIRSLMAIQYPKRELMKETLFKMMLNSLNSKDAALSKEIKGVMSRFGNNAAIEFRGRVPRISVKGRLLSRKDKIPLAGVTVLLGEIMGDDKYQFLKDLMARTDSDGFFFFKGVPLSVYTIVYSQGSLEFPFISKDISLEPNLIMKSGVFRAGQLDEGRIELSSPVLNRSLIFTVTDGKHIEFIPDKGDQTWQFEVF